MRNFALSVIVITALFGTICPSWAMSSSERELAKVRRELVQMKSMPFGGFPNQMKAVRNLQSMGFQTNGQLMRSQQNSPATPAGGDTGMDTLSVVLVTIIGAALVGAIIWLAATRWNSIGLVAQVGTSANRLQGSERMVASVSAGRVDIRVEPANPTPVIPPAQPVQQGLPFQPGVAWVQVPVTAGPVHLGAQAAGAPAGPAINIAPVFNVGGIPVPAQTQQQAQTP